MNEIWENEDLIRMLFMLVGFFLGHRLAIGRDRTRERIAATECARKIINSSLSDIRNGGFGINPDVPKELENIYDYIPWHGKIGYLIFKALYTHCCKNSGYMDDSEDWVFTISSKKTKFILNNLKRLVPLR